MAAYLAAIELLIEIGPEVIQKRVLMLAGRLAEGLAERDYELVQPWPREPRESSGIISFRRPGASAGEVLRELGAAGVIGRAHVDFVRLAPHFYNTQAEVDRVLDMLAPHEIAMAPSLPALGA
jgi:selenocysteine lyase/cysteine desulfurase